jgi:vacuolar-type H+-ATPase subunit H
VHERDFDPTTRGPNSGATSSATGTAQQAKETAKETAKDVAGTAKEQAKDVAGTAKEQGRQVASQVGTQARSVVSDVRQSVAGQARSQNDKLAGGLRSLADELGNMHGGNTDSPAGQIVSRLGDTGRRAADYLESRGPEGLLDDVQEFARRKPGTFLLAAAAAGFVIGRLGRTTISAARSDDSSNAGSGTVYESRTAYDAAPPATSSLLDDPYAAPATATTAYDTPVGGTTAVGTASVDPTGYPTDPVGVPERGTLR